MKGSWPRLIGRRPIVVLAVTLLLLLVALPRALDLELVADLPSLLPDSSPAAQAYRSYLETFGDHQMVFVILSAATSDEVTRQELVDAAFEMAQHLESGQEIARARAGISPEDEQRYLEEQVRRAPLLLSEDHAPEIAQRLTQASIQARVREIRSQLLSPAGAALRPLMTHDPLGFGTDLRRIASASALVGIDPLTMAFVSPDGQHALVLAEPRASELDSEAGRRLTVELSRTHTRIEESLGIELEMHAIGGPLYAAHDEAAIREDLKKTVSSTGIACGALLIAAFAGVGIPAAAVLAITAGLTWLAAIMVLVSGGVSMVVVGFAAVLIGLGIDTTIHGGSCYRRLRLDGSTPDTAIQKTFAEVGPAVLTATGTTIAAFAVLLSSRLPSFKELGLIVAIGLVTITAASASVGAAAAVAWDRSLHRQSFLWSLIGRAVDKTVHIAEIRPKTVLLMAALLTAALAPVAGLIELDPGLEALRPENNPMHAGEVTLADAFGIGEDTATILVRGPDMDDALQSAERIRTAITATDPDLLVISPDQHIVGPRTAAKRLQVLRQMPFADAAQTLRRELAAAGFDPTPFQPGIEALEAFGNGSDPGPVDLGDELLAEDSRGNSVAALAIRSAPGQWRDGPPKDLRDAVYSAVPNAEIASAQLLGEDLKNLAGADLGRLVGIGVLLVVVVVLISFKGRATATALALTPVALGVIWSLGVWGALGRSLDLVCLAVLPVILGLGIDDGLYAVHGAGGSSDSIGQSVRRAGRAMVLTTLTTGIGFVSLGFSHIPGLRSAGLLVPLAVVACLLTTLIVLPAVTSLSSRAGSR